MRIELKEFIERVVEDLIRKDDDLGLPIQSTWEKIYYEFEDFMEEVEESYFEEELEEIFGGIHTMKEIKEYTIECFDDVLEKYVGKRNVEKEIWK